MKKRIFASLLALVMAFSLLPASALAALDEPSVMALPATRTLHVRYVYNGKGYPTDSNTNNAKNWYNSKTVTLDRNFQFTLSSDPTVYYANLPSKSVVSYELRNSTGSDSSWRTYKPGDKFMPNANCYMTINLGGSGSGSSSHTAKVRVIPVYEDNSNLGYTPDYSSNVHLDLTCLNQNCGSGNINHSVKIADFHPSKLGWTIRSGYEWKGWIKYTQNLNLGNVQNPPFKTYYDWSRDTTNLVVGKTNEIYMVYGKKAAPQQTFTLNYDANGGSNAPAPQTGTSNTGSYTFTVSDTVPTKQDFDFKGWSDTRDGSAAYKAGDTITVTTAANPKTIYAVWEESEPVAEPDLSITKTTDAKDVKVGDPFDYTITVSNAAGAGNATNVVVKDILPNGLEYVSYATDYPDKQGWEFDQNGQELTWTFKEIPAGASVTITLTVKAVTATSEGADGYTNKAYIAGKENNPGTAPAVPVGNALTLTKTSTVQTVNVGEIFSYTLKVKNVSKSDATDVVVEDVLPDSLAFYAESVRGQSGTYQFEQDAQNPQALKWTFGTIPAGAEVTITLRVKAISAGTVKNSASITGVTEVESEDVSIVTPGKGTLTIVKKVSSKLDEDADFTFTLKRYTITENGRVLDEKFTHDPIVVHVAKNSDTGFVSVDLPEIPVSTVYTVEEENPTSELKMEGTTGVFSKAEYSCEMSSKDENGNPISTGEMAPCDSFSTLWPGQEITSVTITCTNTYELTAPAKYPVTVNKSYASSTGAGDYAADETVTIYAGSRSNYKFDGWTSDSTDVTFADAKKADTTFTMPKHAVTVTASWTYTGSSRDDDDYDYTLRYVTNGGKAISSESKSRSWVKDYEDLPVPTRVGYRFNGWYYDTKLTKAVTGDVQVSSRTVTLYAGWTENSVPAILNGDDHFAYIQGYDDGTVRPNTPVTRAQVATILFRLLDEDVRDKYLTETNTFTDVAADYWANTAISTMASLGVFKGRTADRFDPNAPITRGEFAAVCARFDDSSVQSSNAFSDIDGYWAKQEILRAAALGWVQGYQDGTFRPTASITRAQVVTMINRVLCRQPETASDLLRGMTTFTDCAEGDWCYLAIQEAANSHDYVGKSGSIYESWTDLNKSADWSKYEH